jgi:DNA repair protein SbcC/Rad50
MLRRMFKGRKRTAPQQSQAPRAKDTNGTPPAQPAPGAEPAADSAAELARIATLSDVDELVDLAVKHRGPIRDAALEHPLLRQAAALTALEKRSRGKDKAVNRHCRRLLDQRKGLLQDAQAACSRAEELAAALRRELPPVTDQAWRERQHELFRRLEEVLQRCTTLGRALAEFGDAVPDVEDLRVDPAELPALDPPEPDPPQATASADVLDDGEPTPAAETFEPLVAEFQALDHAMSSGSAFADIAAARQALTERWLASADRQPPSAAQHQVFESVSHRFRELADAMERLAQVPAFEAAQIALPTAAGDRDQRRFWDALSERRSLLRRLEKFRQSIRWPDWAPPPQDLDELTHGIDTLSREIEGADRLLHEALDVLSAQVEELSRAIDDGSLNEARSLLTEARKRHDALPAQATRDIGKRLGQQAARLAELNDWQTFATTPKRQALVDAMQALADAPIAPADQADRIKALRRQWQALGPVTQAADGRLANRFNAAAEQAFEPCRAYFAEQAETRKANLEQRRRLCDELERYLAETDWARADMAAAQQIMRTARDEWRRFHPVDRQRGRNVEQRFETLQEQLHDRVKAEWQRNLQAKEALIAEAQALLDDDRAMPDKIAAAKSLQQRWRDIGITPRRADQELWRAFRGACDALFAARENAQQAAQEAQAGLERELGAVMDTFAAHLDSLAADAASDAELRQFRQETTELERLPPARRRPLEQRRAELMARYAALQKTQQRQRDQARLAAVRRWDEELAAAETQGADALGPEDAADQPVSDAVAAARHSCAGEPVPLDALRRLTVRAELAAGRESPAADEALRLEVQVERLQAGLSGGAQESAGASQVWSLADDWCRLGPKDDSVTALRERFFAALAALS